MKAAALLIPIALASCATVPPAEPGPTAAIGQLAQTNGIRVQPISLIEDSRCPALVRCVWAGRVRVLTLVDLRGGSEERRTVLTLAEPLQTADGALTLVAVTPQKTVPGEVDPRAYRFTFEFQRGP